MVGSCSPRPSAAKRLSRGMVYPWSKGHQTHSHSREHTTNKYTHTHTEREKERNMYKRKIIYCTYVRTYTPLRMGHTHTHFMPQENTKLTFGFFQLDIQGGIFQSCCSRAVTLRVGECRTGAGGDGGPLGIFLLVLGKRKHN